MSRKASEGRNGHFMRSGRRVDDQLFSPSNYAHVLFVDEDIEGQQHAPKLLGPSHGEPCFHIGLQDGVGLTRFESGLRDLPLIQMVRLGCHATLGSLVAEWLRSEYGATTSPPRQEALCGSVRTFPLPYWACIMSFALIMLSAWMRTS